MRVLASRSAAKTLSEKIVLLLNREGWSEVATECIISLPNLRMQFLQVLERFGTWGEGVGGILYTKLCVRKVSSSLSPTFVSLNRFS